MWLDRLKEMKKLSRKTSQKISDETGISKSTIDKLFIGRTKDPSLSQIRAIVHCLGYTLDDLDDSVNQYIRPSIISNDSNKKKQLIDNYEKLNVKGKEKLIEYSDDLVSSKKYIKDKYVTVVKAARNKNGQHSIEKVQMTEEELSIFDIAPQSDEDL